jgi:SAM-dependent methyltransferase
VFFSVLLQIPQIDMTVLLFALAAFVSYFFLSGFIWGAGFQSTPKKDIDLAAQLLNLETGTVVYDLGSGTGQVITHLARKYKVNCVGIEIDPLKVSLSRLRVLLARKGLRSLVEIRGGNFLSEDLSRADVIYVFLSGGTKIMRTLEQKLQRELREGAKIVSYVHIFPDWKPIVVASKVKIYSISNLKQRP